MISIELQGIEFFAHHGLYVDEQQKGNKFLVNIIVKANAEESLNTDDISKTVNYEDIYDIVVKEMQQPSKLLEHVVSRIGEKVLANLPSVVEVEIALSKLNPPLKGPCHASKVTLLLKR